MANVRDELRQRLLSSVKAKSKQIVLFGVDVEMRQPSLKEVLSMSDAQSTTQDMVVGVLLNHCYVPGTDEKVFEPSDTDTILSWPVGSWLEEVTSAIQELTGVEMESAKKDSDGTANSS